ncbi:MAG: 2-isopropylmalate synthase [Leptospirales bacterium]
MKQELVNKYKPYKGTIQLENRTWPDQAITKHPHWCSVDLRDGNQALILPMDIQEKVDMFALLVDIGFKEIEIGFPSASALEYNFLRRIIDEGLIPEDVTVQVLTQARQHLIEKTFESLKGAKKAVLHLYNSTSALQRKVVFKKNREEIKSLAVEGTKMVKKLATGSDTEITLEYSPESFTGTETEYALEVCEAVLEAWAPKEGEKVIFNLPATVEMYTPNVYADTIEWFSRNLSQRDKVMISLHAHNDRGTAVAATELALMAGADRVEGTLFGNGERTGNVDIVTLALNMYCQGVDPGLDFHDINRIIGLSENVTKIPVHVRHPYAGELVYTAFSGSHQDAINKGMSALREENNPYWEVPYLPIDPEDLGRTYESVIRINSQSGKGGVAYILESRFGFLLPKKMHQEMGPLVQRYADLKNDEILPEKIMEIFRSEYLESKDPFEYISFRHSPTDIEGKPVESTVTFQYKSKEQSLKGVGNGPIDACKNSLITSGLVSFSILNYYEHSLQAGSDAQAVAYIQILYSDKGNEKEYFGVGIHSNIEIASIKAMFSALNRALR